MITDIKGHKAFNKKLLNYFSEMPCSNTGKISKTDWKLDIKEKNYVNYFLKKIKPYYNKISKIVGFDKWGWKIHNIWFQIYNKNDEHKWHNHQYANWSNVYYVKLPNKNMSTELYNRIKNKPIKINVKEGQLLTFPANVMHRSPVNKTDKQKIIVSFNSDILIEKV